MPESIPIVRTFDAARINALVNEPTIRPYVGGDGKSRLDLSEVVANRENHFIAGEHGAFAFTWTAPGIYEVHTFVQPAGRGAWSRGFALAARDYMDAQPRMDKLWTRVPADAPNVVKFTIDAGFSRCGSQTIDIGGGPTSYDLYEWMPPCRLH